MPIEESLGREKLIRLLAEYATRKMEALRLYRPLPNALRFHQSLATERLVIGSNRAGKSQCCGAEMAWWLLGTHPYQNVPRENARFTAVGWDWDHIGRVMWPKIGLPGSFRIIRDERTRQWRPVYPDNEYDAANKEKWKDAPPFVPPGMIANIAWESRKNNQPAYVFMKNGTRLQFCSSVGEAKQGDALHGWWADEELENERWVQELQRGCTSTGGGGFYSATPLAQSSQLYEMHRRAIDPENAGDIAEFNFSIEDNPHITKAAKAKFYKQLLTPHDILVRWHGQFDMGGLMVYPAWEREKHVIEPFPIPEGWTRYMTVDPGVQVCAVLFVAVPPPEDMEKPGTPHKYANQVHVYDELYIKRCSASMFASEVAKAMGSRKRGEFEAFIIDHQMGRQADVGSGNTVEIQYTDALAAEGVYSKATGSGFLWGTSDVRSREEALWRWMLPHPLTEKPVLQVHNKCANLIWEFPQQFYRKSRETGLSTGKRRDAHDHAVTALEYIADMNPQWVAPTKARMPDSWAVAALKEKMKKARDSRGGAVSLGPDGVDT